MNCFFRAAAAAAAIAAGGAGAASATTIASFSAYGSARVWIETVYFAGTTVDARDVLHIDDYDSDSLEYDYTTPGATARGSVDVGDRGAGPGFRARGIAEGSAMAAPAYAEAGVADYADFFAASGDWCNADPVLCATPLDLTFGYELMVDVFAQVAGSSTGTADAGADALLWFGWSEGDYDTVFRLGAEREAAPGMPGSHTDYLTGVFSVMLGPEVPLFFGVEAGGRGSLDVGPTIAPVPLPAALPLLGVGIAALAALGRRRGTRA